MKRTLILCVVVALALAARSSPSTAATKTNKLFTVKLSVVETKDGQARPLAEPVMVVREGEPAGFLSGGQVPENVGPGAIEYVPFGIQAGVTVRELAADSLYVSLNVSDDVLAYEKNGDFTIRRSGTRCVRTIRPGDSTVLDLGEGRTATVTVLPTASGK